MPEYRTNRRRLVAAGGALGTSAVSGCSTGSGDPTASSQTDAAPPGVEQRQQSTPTDATTFDALEAESINRRIEVTTDDDLVAKLQSAEAGDVLVLESGLHEVDEPLRRDVNNLTIVGQGWRATTIRRTGDFPLLELIGTERDPNSSDRRRGWLIRDLQLHSNGDGTADLVSAQYADTHRWENVAFHGWGADGNNLYAHECWDWKFYACFFAAGGNPDAGTADVYAYNGEHDSTNNFHFVSCRWEKLNSYALYSDTSGDGLTRNSKFYFANCKLHGFPPDESQTPDLYPIEGVFGTLKISNSHFIGTKRGWIHQVEGGGNTVQLVNNNFRRYAEACLRLESKENYVANNSFWSSHAGSAIHLGPGAHETALVGNITGGIDPSVVVESPRTTVTGNVIDFDGWVEDRPSDLVGLTVRGSNDTVGDNVINGSPSHGLLVQGASGIALGSNVVLGAGGDAIRLLDTTGGTVVGNFVREADGAGLTTTGSSDALAVCANTAWNTGGISVDGGDSESVANVTR